MTEPSANMPPLDCGNLGKLNRPTLLVTGERSPAMFLLITAELERCLEGESQVMVPDAGHGMHRQNTAFYNQAVWLSCSDANDERTLGRFGTLLIPGSPETISAGLG